MNPSFSLLVSFIYPLLVHRSLLLSSGNFGPSCPLDRGGLVLSLLASFQHAMSKVKSCFVASFPALNVSLSFLDPYPCVSLIQFQYS